MDRSAVIEAQRSMLLLRDGRALRSDGVRDEESIHNSVIHDCAIGFVANHLRFFINLGLAMTKRDACFRKVDNKVTVADRFERRRPLPTVRLTAT